MVAPNKAFRDTLVESMARGNAGYRDDGQALIRSSWSFAEEDYGKSKALEVLIVDEAHRLKDKAYQYRGKSMVEDMVRASRISVFFLDETQRVTWSDAGSLARIDAAAKKFGAAVHPVLPLSAQFRCAGSDGYLNWVDDVLQIRPTANFDNWASGDYEFGVFDRAEDLHAALHARNGENKARLIAGYLWPWPTKTRGRTDGGAHVVADMHLQVFGRHGVTQAEDLAVGLAGEAVAGLAGPGGTGAQQGQADDRGDESDALHDGRSFRFVEPGLAVAQV